MFLLQRDKEALLLPQTLGTCIIYMRVKHFPSQVSYVTSECSSIVTAEQTVLKKMFIMVQNF